MTEDIETRLVAKIRDLSDFGGEVRRDSDVSYDIRLEGDDLEDLLIWLRDEFGVDFSQLKAREFNLNEPPAVIRSWFGRRRFKSMTVGALLDAIKARRWVTK